MTKLGIIGCGGMAGAHARGLGELAARLKVAALVDIDSDRAAAAAALFPGSVAATDYRAILDQVDAVLIALPHHLHCQATLDALSAGCHVLVEKPMANTEAECLAMIDAAERAGRVLMVAYCMRFHPLVLAFRQAMLDGAAGDIFQVSIWTEQHTQYPPDHWAMDPVKLGGGQLFSHGCHYIDILLWLLGEPLRGTHLGTNTGTPWMAREGTSNVQLAFAGGRLGYHFGTWGARGTRLGYSFHGHGTEGLLELSYARNQLVLLRHGQEQVLAEAQPGKHTPNEMAHFLDCLEHGAQPLTDGWDSLQGLRVIWRLYEAEREHRVADLTGLGIRCREGWAPA